jgi:hypothetical protein
VCVCFCVCVCGACMSIQKRQPRETGIIRYTRHKMMKNKTKTQHNMQTNINNVNKT